MKKLIILIIIIFFLHIPFVKTQNYIIEDDYDLMISIPDINNKKISNEINDFVNENRKLYKKTKQIMNDTQLVINYEKTNYKNLESYTINAYIFYENNNNDYIENNYTFNLENDKKICFKDIVKDDTSYNLLIEKISNGYIKTFDNFILNNDSLVFKYEYQNKIIELKVNHEEISQYLKDEYKNNNISLMPYSNIKKRDLQKYKNKKLIALTFDDGPSIYTKILLDELKKRDAKVTFFVVGNKINEYSETILKAYKEGHQIGSHTFNHKNLLYLKDEQIKQEISKTNELIYNIIGQYPSALRVPYGNVNDKIKQIALMNNILWNVDTKDWKYKNSNKVYNRILRYSSDGDVVLLHDIFKTSIKGALKAIDTLKEEGYEFVTIDEMAYLKGVQLNYNKTYFYFD